MMHVTPVFALHNPLAIEKDFNSDCMKFNPSNLMGWSRQVTDSMNAMADNQRGHDAHLNKLVEKITAAETFNAEAKDFMEYISSAYPHVMAEYLMTRAASKRIAP